MRIPQCRIDIPAFILYKCRMPWELSQELITGFFFTLLAGLCTGVGAAFAFFVKRSDARVLTYALGASAGVMVYISFMELMPTAQQYLSGDGAKWIIIASFFGGMLLSGGIDRLIPADENPHEIREPHEIEGVEQTGQFSGQAGVKRSASLFALAIAIHNFPEGIATMASAFDDTGTAASVALAVAIHNIPEGLAVAIPLLYGTGNRMKAFRLATLSGLSEPLGALIAMLILLPFLTPTVLGILFAVVAGIMVYIAFDELLPMAERCGLHHLSIYGVISGMLLMAVVL